MTSEVILILIFCHSDQWQTYR